MTFLITYVSYSKKPRLYSIWIVENMQFFIYTVILDYKSKCSYCEFVFYPTDIIKINQYRETGASCHTFYMHINYKKKLFNIYTVIAQRQIIQFTEHRLTFCANTEI